MKTDDYPRRTSDQLPESDNFVNKDLSPVDEAELFGNGPETPKERLSNNAVKGGAWLLAIVGIFAVAILIAFFVSKHNDPLSSRSDTRMENALSHPITNTAQKTHIAGESPAQYMAILVPVTRQGATYPYDTKTSSSKSSQTINSSSSTSDSYNARIEEEAREVILGEYGDNPGRKEKLGDDYAAVQARVNQILTTE